MGYNVLRVKIIGDFRPVSLSTADKSLKIGKPLHIAKTPIIIDPLLGRVCFHDTFSFEIYPFSTKSLLSRICIVVPFFINTFLSVICSTSK